MSIVVERAKNGVKWSVLHDGLVFDNFETEADAEKCAVEMRRDAEIDEAIQDGIDELVSIISGRFGLNRLVVHAHIKELM